MSSAHVRTKYPTTPDQYEEVAQGLTNDLIVSTSEGQIILVSDKDTNNVPKKRSHSPAHPLKEDGSIPSSSKKRRRRTAAEVMRSFRCDVPNCNKSYGTEGALKMHKKIKHPGIIRTPTQQQPGTPQLQELSLEEGVAIRDMTSFLITSPDEDKCLNSHLLIGSPVSTELYTNVAGKDMIAAKHSDIPLLVLSIGKWQKRSQFCGDTMARFCYEERKFIWEIYNLNSLFTRMEIPFDNVVQISYEQYSTNIQLIIEVCTPPQFFEGTIQAHQPTTWRATTNDPTRGEATVHKRHNLYLLSICKTPLEHLIKVEPRFAKILKSNAPSANKSTSVSMLSPFLAVSSKPQVQMNFPSLSVRSPAPSLLCDNFPLRDTNAQLGHLPNLVLDVEDFSYEEARSQSLSGMCSNQNGDITKGTESNHAIECPWINSINSCGVDCDCAECNNSLTDESPLDLNSSCSSASSSPPTPSPLMYLVNDPDTPEASLSVVTATSSPVSVVSAASSPASSSWWKWASSPL